MNTSTIDPFQALSDPGRRQILMMIAKEKRSINAIADAFDISRPAVSKHIKILSGAGFIAIQDKGRERVCSLNQAGFKEIEKWMLFFENYWKNSLDNLENFLKTEPDILKRKN